MALNKMSVRLMTAVLATAISVDASQNAIGSQGYYTITTPGFDLQLDIANQVATGLTAKQGPNAGNADFNFLLPTADRTDDGFYVSSTRFGLSIEVSILLTEPRRWEIFRSVCDH